MQREIDAGLLSKPEAPDWAARVYGKQPFAGAGKSNSGFLVPLERRLAAWVLPLDSGLRRELAAGFAAQVAVFIRSLATPRRSRPRR